MQKKKLVDIKEFFYITHIDNLSSIMKYGILSHQMIEQKKLAYTAIYDSEIVSNRREKTTPDGKSLWNFANLYFQPRNPMLYQVIQEKERKDIVLIGVQSAAMRLPNVFLTDGNAASEPTVFFNYQRGIEEISKNWKTIMNEWWNASDGSKRKIMAECLVPDLIPRDMIRNIYVSNHDVAEKVKAMGLPGGPSIIPEPNLFFNPKIQYTITPTLFLADGDMFFSNMQTLTVSVNTVGIMGKGLASRAKYQFPDVYVEYQDVCKNKKLQMGKPFLYKRETSFDNELADEPGNLSTLNGVKWFLLFATKKHWREDSDMTGIDMGLNWLVENYKPLGITSIALPALGCGLGNLAWKEIGPLMCKKLARMEIKVVIYLPREIDIPPDYLTPQYLLGKSGG